MSMHKESGGPHMGQECERFPLLVPHVRTSAERKAQPVATGVLQYFPKAMAAVAEVSRRGNEKHNPGEPLHWAREKSTDEADSAVRHIIDALAEGPLSLDDAGNPNLAAAAWRVLAWLERVLDGDERWRTVAKGPPFPAVGRLPDSLPGLDVTAGRVEVIAGNASRGK